VLLSARDHLSPRITFVYEPARLARAFHFGGALNNHHRLVFHRPERGCGAGACDFVQGVVLPLSLTCALLLMRAQFLEAIRALLHGPACFLFVL
jgi:hypothetical protein